MAELPEDFTFYPYSTSKAAAIVFAIIFLLSTSLHTFQMIKQRAWYLLALIVGALCMYIPTTSSQNPTH
jgi:hypothetical protein